MKKIIIKSSRVSSKKNKAQAVVLTKKKKSSLLKPERKKRTIKSNFSTFNKYIENPIISPKEDNSWEAWQVFNPGVIFLKNKIHFIYRAIDGLTSIDVTKKGIDKAYGIRQVQKRLSIPIRKMAYVGDALYKGGNDFAVVKTGINTVQIADVEETKYLIRKICK